MSIVDQYHDTAYGVLYQRLAEFPDLYEVVKTAELEPGGDTALPSSAFAWPDERRFPLHTREQAAISYMYAKTASEVPDEVRLRLENALQVYGVSLESYATAKVASASTESRYAIPELQLLDLNDIEKTASVFEEQAERLTPELRATAAVAIASEGVRPSVKLAQYAGLTTCNTRRAADWIEARAEVADETHKLAYRRLAEGMRAQPVEVTDRYGLAKVAAAIDDLDREAGLRKYYDRRLPDPLRTVFNTEKISGETVDVAGHPISVEELSKLSASFWSDLGGPELAREVAPGGRVDPSKVAMVVETLPLDLKLVLRKQMGC